MAIDKQRMKEVIGVRTRLECAAAMLKMASDDVGAMRPYETEQLELNKQIDSLLETVDALSRSAFRRGGA